MKETRTIEPIYGISDLEIDAWAGDIGFEKTFNKKYIIGGEAGYMYLDDPHLYESSENKYKKGDTWTWYISGHFIYREKVGIAYPGIAFRYEYVNLDEKFKDESDLSYDRYGVCFSYWLTSATRIGIGADFMKAKSALREYFKTKNGDDSTTNWYLGIYAQF